MVIEQIRHELRTYLGRYPHIFFAIIRLRNKKNHYLVRSDSRIVIEGFPRSGNTFSVAAFNISQNGQGHIARHMHVPAQVIQGVRLQIPTLILIREPLDACISYIVRYPYLTPRMVLREYVSFYRTIYPYRNGYTTATFDEVTQDFGKVLGKVKQKFSIPLNDFQQTPENLKKVFELIDIMDMEDTGNSNVTASTVARPDQRRNPLKQEVKASFLDDKLKPLLAKAQTIYKEFRELAANENPFGS